MQLIRSETDRRLRSHHPQAAGQIDNLRQVLDDTSVDKGLLDLCGNYFEAALRGRDWAPSETLTELESACLDVCAQFMLSVADVRDEQIAALNQHLGADDVYNLMCAIYLIEASKRLELTLEAMLP